MDVNHFKVNSNEYRENIDKLAHQLVNEIRSTPVDGLLILNILNKQVPSEKIIEVQRNMETLADHLNRIDIEIIVTTRNEQLN